MLKKALRDAPSDVAWSISSCSRPLHLRNHDLDVAMTVDLQV